MSGKNTVPAVERALDILELLLSYNRAMSINEISEQLRIPRISVFRIIKSLEIKGYVQNKDDSGKYILGAKAVSLGSSVVKEGNLTQIAGTFMYELARKTGQTVQLGVLFEYQIMYIDQIRTEASLTLMVPVRTPFAVNISAGGKVLVAHLPDEQLHDFLKNTELRANTPKSIVDKKRFYDELMKIKAQGYATDDEEFAKGIRCVAAPIFNAQGDITASVGITGHTQEITDNKLDEMITFTIQAGEGISKALGYSRNA